MSKLVYEHIRPEVENVAIDYMEIPITKKEIEDIAVLISNNDPSIPNTILYDDPQDFLDYGNDDDWSHINDQIENVIEWYLGQNELYRIFAPKKQLNGD